MYIFNKLFKGDIKMNLGEKIKQRRRGLGISQEKLSELVGVHENTIRKWEKGSSFPDAIELKNIAKALGTTTSYLCDETDSTSNSASFIKNSAYQDKTEIQNSVPSMAYWGSLVDNAEKTAENGKNIDVIIGLVKTALNILETAIKNIDTNGADQDEHEGYVKGSGKFFVSSFM